MVAGWEHRHMPQFLKLVRKSVEKGLCFGWSLEWFGQPHGLKLLSPDSKDVMSSCNELHAAKAKGPEPVVPFLEVR